MASIHGTWFLLVGLVVTIISYFNQDLRVFLYVGMLFVAYGVFKLILEYINTPKKDETPQKNPSAYQMNQPAQQVKQQTQNPQQVIYCRNCGRRLLIQDNFCPNCGMRQRQ